MKEYFTTSYEQKRKEKLIKLSETYDKLLSSYKSYNPDEVRDINVRNKLETKITDFNKQLINELNKSADLIEQQIKIYENKLTELSSLKEKLVSLEDKGNAIITFKHNLAEADNLNKKATMNNLILLILCCLLLVVLIILNIL